jgi:AcrR family transcriptional regulator
MFPLRENGNLSGNFRYENSFHSFAPDFRDSMSEQHDRIIEGARELFFRHGMKSVTMDDLAGHLGISKKTLYQYYNDKDALVFDITTREIRLHAAAVAEIRKQSADAIQEILSAMKIMSAMMNKIAPTVFYDLQKYYKNSWKSFTDFKNHQMCDFIEENLRRGIRQGLYRKELNLKIMARLRLEELQLGFNPEVFPPDRFNIFEVQLSMMEHFLHGIVTLKGYEFIEKYKSNLQ